MSGLARKWEHQVYANCLVVCTVSEYASDCIHETEAEKTKER